VNVKCTKSSYSELSASYQVDITFKDNNNEDFITKIKSLKNEIKISYYLLNSSREIAILTN
jgi:hypothetical protein